MDVSTLFKSSNIAKPSLKILEIADGLAMSDDLAEQTMHDAFYLAQKLPMMMFFFETQINSSVNSRNQSIETSCDWFAPPLPLATALQKGSLV